LKKEVISTVPADELSGGERAKILLAAIVANQANLLIMDEPTNNLDITTIEALESALKTYRGSIIITSHDREFLGNLEIDQEIKLPNS
jgi:ATP-binding cassette subfamily F protein uup